MYMYVHAIKINLHQVLYADSGYVDVDFWLTGYLLHMVEPIDVGKNLDIVQQILQFKLEFYYVFNTLGEGAIFWLFHK